MDGSRDDLKLGDPKIRTYGKPGIRNQKNTRESRKVGKVARRKFDMEIRIYDGTPAVELVDFCCFQRQFTGRIATKKKKILLAACKPARQTEVIRRSMRPGRCARGPPGGPQ